MLWLNFDLRRYRKRVNLLKQNLRHRIKKAKLKVDRLSKSSGLKVQALEKKSHFIYKIKKGSDKIITGKQEAYGKDELERALTKLGYEIVSVNKLCSIF